ncbi:MAG TPA: hypothetical protein VGP36_02065 [Mycobacteriales bacterium]|jgi:hypothetical protein|nr:hypothetical protein [Mycobacteriales bacterium]
MTTLRTMTAKTLVAATAVVTAALGLGVAAAAPASASATTLPGPAYVPGGDVLPQIDGTTGNPALIGSDSFLTGQVISDPNDSSAWGTPAQTSLWFGSNTQRLYFHRVDTRRLTYDALDSAGISHTVSMNAGAYKIMHYTADGHALCLDADGSHGAPGAGAAVNWYGCDPNAANQPNQLWTMGTVAGRPDDTSLTLPALVNLGPLPNPQVMDIRTAPILTMSGAAGSPLVLEAQNEESATGSSWLVKNADPVPAGVSPGCTEFLC